MRLINQFSFLELSIVGCCRRRQKQRLMLGSRFSLFFVEHISDHFCWFLMHATFLVVFNVVSYSLTPLHHLFSSTRLYSYPCLFSVRNFPSASLLLNLLSTDIVDIVWLIWTSPTMKGEHIPRVLRGNSSINPLCYQSSLLLTGRALVPAKLATGL